MSASFFKFSSSFFFLLSITSCALFSSNEKSAVNEDVQKIENPFAGFTAPRGPDNQNITLRTRQGDHAVEVELSQDQASELTVPMNLKNQNRGQSNEGSYSSGEDGVDHHYASQKATAADREIASTFGNKDDAVTDAKKREIEASLGLQATDELPNMDESYLAKVDIIKQFFHSGRYEASLIEIDHLLKAYPTNGRLYEMRGTVLDRLGYTDLAIRSWKQALEFQPRRLSLKRVIEKREQQRSVASEKR